MDLENNIVVEEELEGLKSLLADIEKQYIGEQGSVKGKRLIVKEIIERLKNEIKDLTNTIQQLEQEEIDFSKDYYVRYRDLVEMANDKLRLNNDYWINEANMRVGFEFMQIFVGYEGDEIHIKIPETINGKRLTALKVGDNMFAPDLVDPDPTLFKWRKIVESGQLDDMIINTKWITDITANGKKALYNLLKSYQDQHIDYSEEFAKQYLTDKREQVTVHFGEFLLNLKNEWTKYLENIYQTAIKNDKIERYEIKQLGTNFQVLYGYISVELYESYELRRSREQKERLGSFINDWTTTTGFDESFFHFHKADMSTLPDGTTIQQAVDSKLIYDKAFASNRNFHDSILNVGFLLNINLDSCYMQYEYFKKAVDACKKYNNESTQQL